MDFTTLKPICELHLVLKPDGTLKERAGFAEKNEAELFATEVYGAGNVGKRIEPTRVVCIDAAAWEAAMAGAGVSPQVLPNDGERPPRDWAEFGWKPGGAFPMPAGVAFVPVPTDSPQDAAPSTQHGSAYELTGETSLKSVMAKAGVLP